MRQVRRRQFLIAAGGLLAAPFARAQRAAAVRTLGLLNPHPAPSPDERARSPAFARLRQLGWIESQNLLIERPEDPAREAALPKMAEELVRKRVEVIWAIGPEAAVAAARATKTIPIVFWGVAYPVEQGLIDSFARPGRNVTGMAFFTGPELVTKVLELLSQIAPRAKRIAAIRTPSAQETVKGEIYEESHAVVRAAAQSLGFDYLEHLVSKREDFDSVFAAILDSRAEGLVAYGTTTTFRERQRIASFANENRLPSAFNQREFVEAGGLFSYGADTWETIAHSTTYIDRILRGARPADLPVERPSKYELAVNLKTAKALGLTVSQSVILRADRVIE